MLKVEKDLTNGMQEKMDSKEKKSDAVKKVLKILEGKNV